MGVYLGGTKNDYRNGMYMKRKILTIVVGCCVIFGTVHYSLQAETAEQKAAGHEVEKATGSANPLGAAPSISEHGWGFLQRVRNESEYPISFSLEKTVHDLLPEGTIIRIKSLRPKYGTAGRYYAVRKVMGGYRIVADTTDPDDEATHFVVSRYISRDLTDYLGVYSNVANGKYAATDDSRAILFRLPTITDEDYSQGHWQITGDGIVNCHLKSRVSGFLSPRGSETCLPASGQVFTRKTDAAGLGVPLIAAKTSTTPQVVVPGVPIVNSNAKK